VSKELKRREAQKSLLAFTEYTNPLYQSAQHHKRICDKLEAVERGDIDRLMIFMPPRTASLNWHPSAFRLGAWAGKPQRQIIAASYNSDLANDFGRNVRNIVDEPEFTEVFPTVSLRPTVTPPTA
jgi:hypothetical protein